MTRSRSATVITGFSIGLLVLASALVAPVPAGASGPVGAVPTRSAADFDALTGATLTGATLTGATLTGATLTGATPTGATLTGATLTGATRIAAGATHTCAIVAGGQVRCWGSNIAGQLGNGSAGIVAATPVAVTGLSGATEITAGTFHTCALVAGGQVRCWGNNSNSQLGNAAAGFTSFTPVAVAGLSGATQISATGDHTCVVVTGGQVRCWGLNGEGQLGNAAAGFNSPTPVAVTGLSGVTSIAAGSLHTCAALGTGQVRCWGQNGSGQLGNATFGPGGPGIVAVSGLTGAVQVGAGQALSCARLTSGQVRCWGSNASGALGNGSVDEASSVPVAVTGLSGVTNLTVDRGHSCAVVSGGQMRCWGNNSDGQLGNGTTVAAALPVAVSGLSGVTATDGGSLHTCAVIGSGQVRCWGNNSFGQLGIGVSGAPVPSPVAVSGFTGSTGVTAGNTHTCSTLTTGQIRCWGGNTSGQLGNGSTSGSSAPVAVSGVSGATAVASGWTHTCALVSGGQARCWGLNTSGQLGLDPSSTVSSSTPVGVPGLSGATRLAAGFAHTCAVVAGGQVRCWGDNSSGQLGNGATSAFSAVPVPVPGLSGATQISAGVSHTCVLLTSGQARCWGDNNSGQLGNGTLSNSAVPVVVTGLTGATQIASGNSHSCVLLAAGQLRCWGANFSGQLGNDSTAGSESTTPLGVIGVSGATQVAAGGDHACAVVSGGQVRCWGSNTSGQIGNGSIGFAPVPLAVGVTGLSGATQLAAGTNHTCARLGSSQVRCWGSNSNGQLGNGATVLSTTPQTVIGPI